MEDEEHSTLKDLITSLSEEMRNSFSNLQEEMTKLRLQLREELDEMKRAATETEKSLDEAWTTIDDLKEDISALKVAKTLQQQELNCLQKELDDTKQKLNEVKEKNIELENYSRRENLKFNNIPEMQGEGDTLATKEIVRDILHNELQIDTSGIRFHAVHRVGKANSKRPRPIIARFLCREDRDNVFKQKKKLQESCRYPDAYITADYTTAIQEERRELIKAMFKAREQGKSSRVVGRVLYVNDQIFTIMNIPPELQSNRSQEQSTHAEEQ